MVKHKGGTDKASHPRIRAVVNFAQYVAQASREQRSIMTEYRDSAISEGLNIA